MKWDERAARNEALFREVNERIATAGSGFDATTLRVICECSRTSCAETFDVRVDEYEAIRARGDRFGVLAPHVDPEIERVIEEKEGFVVVEKLASGAQVARRLDPRSSA
jgi:hypothetical protein